MPPSNTKIKVVGISGSRRSPSNTWLSLKLCSKKLEERGAEVTLLNLRELNLPFCNGDKSEAYPDFPDVQKMRETVLDANALILGTPEYHGSVSGALKNALDQMTFEHFDQKVVGLISVLGGVNNTNSLNHLRLIMRQLHAWCIPEQIAIAKAITAFDDKGKLREPMLEKRFDAFAESLIENTRKLFPLKK